MINGQISPMLTILNEKLMPKAVCEKIFGSNINEINEEWEKNRYNSRLKKVLQSNNSAEIYKYLISEYRAGRLQKNDSFATLFAISDTIPLKNEMGEIVNTKLFLCDQPVGYFSVAMLQKMIVHKECSELAKSMRYLSLDGIHYDDINYYEPLTADDVEALSDDYLINSEEILRGFYRDGLLSDELLKEYELDYLAIGRVNDNEDIYEFPSVQAGDRKALRKHVTKQWQNPIKVVAVKEVRTVHKGENKDGARFDLGIQDARDGALRTYTPEGGHNICFCQMCHRVKPYGLMEVNNIELNPQYYFPQLRISLCLECSKQFEALRSNQTIRKKFIHALKNTAIYNQGTIDIEIGNEDTITFTAKHLAEVQEILRQMPTEKRYNYI